MPAYSIRFAGRGNGELEIEISLERELLKRRHKTAALYNALKERIRSGTLPPGSKLPSTRALAEMCGISRGTVNTVYGMLHAEGYVTAVTGSGTYTAFAAPKEMRRADADAAAEEGRLSAWGRRLLSAAWTAPESPGEGADDGVISFTLGQTDLTRFDFESWNRLLFAEIRAFAAKAYDGRFAAQGHRPLREAIAAHLRRFRGIPAVAEDVLIVNGSQQAITLLIHLLVEPGEAVVVENPCYGGIPRAVHIAGGRTIPCDVDDQGIRVPDAKARLAFVTPSRQFPTGAVLSLERRLSLLKWAERCGAWIVEDDYDGEFRRKGRPVEPLKSLDKAGRVIHIGTFSRTMFAGIRLGYVVAPPPLREALRRAKALFEPHPVSILEQRALAEFMRSGLYERHLRRMNRIYKKRGELLAALVREQLADRFHVFDSDTGLHIYAIWRGSGEEYRRFAGRCAENGVRWTDAAVYHIGNSVPSACFGFPHLDESQIAEGVRRMAQAANV